MSVHKRFSGIRNNYGFKDVCLDYRFYKLITEMI